MKTPIIQKADSPVICSNPDGSYFTLDYEVIIHELSPLLTPKIDDPQFADDYTAGERLAGFLNTIPYIEGEPYFTTYQGPNLILELTEDDAIKFKVFFC